MIRIFVAMLFCVATVVVARPIFLKIIVDLFHKTEFLQGFIKL